MPTKSSAISIDPSSGLKPASRELLQLCEKTL